MGETQSDQMNILHLLESPALGLHKSWDDVACFSLLQYILDKMEASLLTHLMASVQ